MSSEIRKASYDLNNLDLDELAPAQLAQLAADCLAKLEPGRQPLPLFVQIARLAVLTTIEISAIRDKGSSMGVLMTQRAADDPWWPNQWHLPGTVLLPTDAMSDSHDYSAPLARIFDGEFHNKVVPTTPITVFDSLRRQDERGSEFTVEAWVGTETKGRLPRDVRVFSPNDLRDIDPSELIEGHHAIALSALDNYTKHK